MSNRAAIRNQLRRLLKDAAPIDTLSASLTAGATSAVLTAGTFAGAPQVWEIGSELIWVPSWTGTTMTGSSLIRGHLGTTAAAAASGDVVRFSPRFPQIEIDAAINNAIGRMGSLGLFQIKTVDLTYNPAVRGYNLASDVMDVYEVRWQTPGPDKMWPEMKSFEVSRDLTTTDFASGNAILLMQGGYPSLAIRVKYRTRYGTFTDDTTDSADSTIGIQSFATDVITVGAAAELSSTEEIKRTQITFAEESRRAEDSPPRHVMSVYSQLDQRFKQRCDETLAHLRRLYPPRSRY